MVVCLRADVLRADPYGGKNPAEPGAGAGLGAIRPRPDLGRRKRPRPRAGTPWRWRTALKKGRQLPSFRPCNSSTSTPKDQSIKVYGPINKCPGQPLAPRRSSDQARPADHHVPLCCQGVPMGEVPVGAAQVGRAMARPLRPQHLVFAGSELPTGRSFTAAKQDRRSLTGARNPRPAPACTRAFHDRTAGDRAYHQSRCAAGGVRSSGHTRTPPAACAGNCCGPGETARHQAVRSSNR